MSGNRMSDVITIKKSKEYKKDLEDKLMRYINEYEILTGLTVDSILVHNSSRVVTDDKRQLITTLLQLNIKL